jgi:hypothetical protein
MGSEHRLTEEIERAKHRALWVRARAVRPPGSDANTWHAAENAEYLRAYAAKAAFECACGISIIRPPLDARLGFFWGGAFSICKSRGPCNGLLGGLAPGVQRLRMAPVPAARARQTRRLRRRHGVRQQRRRRDSLRLARFAYAKHWYYSNIVGRSRSDLASLQRSSQTNTTLR